MMLTLKSQSPPKQPSVSTQEVGVASPPCLASSSTSWPLPSHDSSVTMMTRGVWVWCGCGRCEWVVLFLRKVATLQLLAGYLSLAGGHVSLMVNSLPHLSRLIKALVQVSLCVRVHVCVCRRMCICMCVYMSRMDISRWTNEIDISR